VSGYAGKKACIVQYIPMTLANRLLRAKVTGAVCPS
jgi:hypothetical protein